MQRSLNSVARLTGALLVRGARKSSVLRRIHDLDRAQLAQLREANEHLVLATVNAKHLREDAEAANRRQNEFLAMLAHELRNPLSPISMAAIAAGTHAAPRAAAPGARDRAPGRPHGAPARRPARRGPHQQRQDHPGARAAGAGRGARQAVETVQPRIAERGQRSRSNCRRTSVVVEGDPVRLAQVFTNLLATPPNTPATAAASPAARSCRRRRMVAISDNGSGIAPRVLPHIFDLFTQGPRSLARSEGGLGVGLNVVRNLVGMHGGTVDAAQRRRRPGQPLHGAPAAQHGAAARERRGAGAEPAQPRRILLVEDNPDACATLASCLAAEGHEVTTAHDGSKRPGGWRAASAGT
jgi:signal transduction histidine kinase